MVGVVGVVGELVPPPPFATTTPVTAAAAPAPMRISFVVLLMPPRPAVVAVGAPDNVTLSAVSRPTQNTPTRFFRQSFESGSRPSEATSRTRVRSGHFSSTTAILPRLASFKMSSVPFPSDPVDATTFPALAAEKRTTSTAEAGWTLMGTD